jgi:hypothetical protein
MEITPEQQSQLDDIEAMLQEILDRVPNGALGRSQSTLGGRVFENRRRRATRQAHVNAQLEADAAWKISSARRESLLLHVLGEDRLTIRELTSRLNSELGYPSPENRNHAVFEHNVRSILRRLLRTGQLERASESFENKIRHRYFRRRPLEGAIVGLEQAYGAE